MYWPAQLRVLGAATGQLLPKQTTVPSVTAIGYSLSGVAAGAPQPVRQPLVYAGGKWVGPTQTPPVMTGGALPAVAVLADGYRVTGAPGPGPSGDTAPPLPAGSVHSPAPTTYVPPIEPPAVSPPALPAVPIPVPGGGPHPPMSGTLIRSMTAHSYSPPPPRPGSTLPISQGSGGSPFPAASNVGGGMVSITGPATSLPGMDAPGSTVSQTANPSIQDTSLTPCQGVPGVCLSA